MLSVKQHYSYKSTLIIFYGHGVLRHVEITPDKRKKAIFSSLFLFFPPTWQADTIIFFIKDQVQKFKMFIVRLRYSK